MGLVNCGIIYYYLHHLLTQLLKYSVTALELTCM
jgi:hypothetical protein